MDRFKHFTNSANILIKEKYLFYVDVDCLFVDKISAEDILSDRVAVQHCGYYKKQGPFEDNINSSLYLDPGSYKFYAGGGFSGGKASSYLEMSKWCYNMIEQDVQKNIIPRFHDETAWNTYLALNPPDKILSPSYHYPQGEAAHYKAIWKPDTFKPKIILLDKDHQEVRS
jgi:hypothetical protein